jgi:hypothetical protein
MGELGLLKNWSSVHADVFRTPLQGFDLGRVPNPGRCPGLM